MKKSKKLIWIAIGVVSLILLWELLSLLVGEAMLLPSPIIAASEFFLLLANPEFYIAAISTALRSLIGFLCAFFFAVLLGSLSFAFPSFKYALSPLITVLRATPTMSVILLSLVWFAPFISPVFIGFLVVFPLLYESVLSALSGVDKKLAEMSKVYRVSLGDRIMKLYAPYSRESVLSGAKSAISLNVKVVIAAEVLAQTSKSIGIYMQISRVNLATAALFGWTAWAVLLSFAFEGLISLVSYFTAPKNRRFKKKVNIQ